MGTEVPAWTMPSAFTGEGWYDEEQVREFQASYQAKSGDMFCVSDMPLDRCISRAIMAMAEEISCWDDSYRNKPFVYRAQASVLGAQACLMKVNAMPGRRRALAGWGAPKDLPCRLPLPTGICTPPKVCVLFSDPRHMFAVILGYAMRRFNLPLSLAEFIHLFVTKKLDKLDIFRYFSQRAGLGAFCAAVSRAGAHGLHQGPVVRRAQGGAKRIGGIRRLFRGPSSWRGALGSGAV